MARPADPHAKEALLAAARLEFAKKGLRGTRVEDVTAACGVSKGAFYLHFPTKEAMFGELVRRFEQHMKEANAQRLDLVRGFHAREGTLTSQDVAERSPRMQKMSAIELECDLRALELMWEYRDVVSVLFTGTQGTEFEGVAWKMMDAEEDRIAHDVKEYQGAGACRTDIPPEVFGSMIVGTYSRIALRMSRMKERPDLRAWAESLQMLIREGSSPRVPARVVQTAAPAVLPAVHGGLRKNPGARTSSVRRAAR